MNTWFSEGFSSKLVRIYYLFEVIFILRSSSFWGHLPCEVVFILRLCSFWGGLHFEVLFILGSSSLLGRVEFQVVFILRSSLRLSSIWWRLHFEVVLMLRLTLLEVVCIWDELYYEDGFILGSASFWGPLFNLK